MNHYEALGLPRSCTTADVRAAYRRLVKEHHPDLHAQSAEAVQRSQQLNAAHEVLSDTRRRREYDRALDGSRAPAPRGRLEKNITQDVNLRLEEFLRGSSLQVTVRDPAQAGGAEVYALDVPAMSAPGTRLRLAREGGGQVIVRLRALPSARFKVRGSDLRCDLRIDLRHATQGGTESVTGLDGRRVSVRVPARVARGEMIRIAGEGLPRARGGRGDLLVRVVYRPEVRISRAR